MPAPKASLEDVFLNLELAMLIPNSACFLPLRILHEDYLWSFMAGFDGCLRMNLYRPD